jgi:lysophospholipase L1-like esterase
MDTSPKCDVLLPRLARRIAEQENRQDGKAVLLVAFGDSVTQGWMEEGVLDEGAVYHALVVHELRRRHRRCTFDCLNAGAGGETLEAGLARLGRDVVRHQPDLVFIGFGLNDSGAGKSGLPAFEERLRVLLSVLHGETDAEAILLTPNMMCHADSPRVSDRWHDALPGLMERQVTGVLALYAEAIREAGTAFDMPVADVYSEWDRLRRSGVDTDALLANGLNHPGKEGHALATRLILEILYGT